jgi:hypothetical protein
MRTNPRPIPGREPETISGSELQPRLATTLLLAVIAWSGCSSAQRNSEPRGGEGGSEETGGSGGGAGSGGSRTGGSGGGGGSGGSGGGGKGGATGMDASASAPPDSGSGSGDVATAGDVAGGPSPDAGGGTTADAPPAVARPDAMGAACATGTNYNFTIRPFASQKGTFTAFFTASPGPPPTNSVIGLSDGMKYIHDDYAVIVRFGTSGNLDARNGAGYTSLTPLPYKNTDYHFRLVVNVPARTYSAYVTFDGMPEVTIGTNLAFRDSAGTPTQLSSWGVEAIAGHQTKVCGFLVVP